MIIKISNIKNFAVFDDFCWDENFPIKEKQQTLFDKINIRFSFLKLMRNQLYTFPSCFDRYIKNGLM